MASTILIVDDEATARESLARLLKAEGFDVSTACDAQEAMQRMAGEPAETVLLDLDLPVVPGDSVAAFLNIRHPRTRIIFMSGHYDMVDPERFGENTLYMPKPLDLPYLVEVLRAKRTSGSEPAATV